MGTLEQQMEKMDVWLAQYDISIKHGFLGLFNPSPHLPRGATFAAWQNAADDLPSLIAGGSHVLRKKIESLPPFSSYLFFQKFELEAAMRVLSFLGHAYIHADPPMATVPPRLAIPWYQVAEQLGRLPILSYASYALHNWRRIDPDGSVSLENLDTLTKFDAGIDERWFILVHVVIEKEAGKLISGLCGAHKLAQEQNSEKYFGVIVALLRQANISFQKIVEVFSRMPEHCDPYIYYKRVRPWIHGAMNNPAFPNGIVYAGCYGGVSQHFHGETGAQSSIIPMVDALLRVRHEKDWLYHYLQEMRLYMPQEHREFLNLLPSDTELPPLRLVAIRNPNIKHEIRECLDWLEQFRKLHIVYAEEYIAKQSSKGMFGTGGTPFIPYLEKHAQDTRQTLCEVA